MEKSDSKIVLFGGSFNPIHNGHLLAAELIRQEYNLKKVIFIPAAKSPHKGKNDLALSQHRLIMSVMATNSNPCFEVCDIEIKRGGESYTIDTVKELEKEKGGDLSMMIGSDTVLEFSTWKNALELSKRCKILVVNRPGYEFKKYFSRQLVANSVASSAGNLLEEMEMVEIKGLDVSSTEIRDLVHQGKSIKYLVPPAIEEYIHKHKIYAL